MSASLRIRSMIRVRSSRRPIDSISLSASFVRTTLYEATTLHVGSKCLEIDCRIVASLFEDGVVRFILVERASQHLIHNVRNRRILLGCPFQESIVQRWIKVDWGAFGRRHDGILTLAPSNDFQCAGPISPTTFPPISSPRNRANAGGRG